jgi:hypothetical protein
MSTRLPWIIFALALLPALAPPSRADAPHFIPVQAILKTVSGQPITNPAQSITISLYTNAVGGAAVYSEA